MYKKRLIPILFLKNGNFIRSQNFKIHRPIGDPILHVKRLIDWDIDELIIIDIDINKSSFAHNRTGHKNKSANNLKEFINLIAHECNIPLAIGGKIRTLNDVERRISYGADKITINQIIYENKTFINECAKIFGSQSIIASIDYKIINETPVIFKNHGTELINSNIFDIFKKLEDLGAGEILLNSIDRDGNANGYDINFINEATSRVKIPVIACGGAGTKDHILECFKKTTVDAIAAGNIFHFTENSYIIIKEFLRSHLNYIR